MANANVVTWSGRSIYQCKLVGTAGAVTPVYVGWGTAANSSAQPNTTTGSAFSDVNLFATGVTTEPRVTGTTSLLKTTQLADTYQVVGTITALGSRAITEVGIFDANTALSPNTTIAATVNSSVTTVTLTGTGAAGMPTAGNYYAQIENEVVLVTAGQGSNSVTVTRGQLGSTAAAHTAPVQITVGGDGFAHVANATTSSQTLDTTGANGGSMFVHADFPVINLNTNDSIQFTLKINLA